MKYLLILIIVSVLITSSCDNSTVNKNSLDSFDISNDDSCILFSATNRNNNASVYRISMDGKSLIKIIASTIDSNFYNPRYSNNNKKILFIGSSSNSHYTDIYISNKDGTERQRITKGDEMISEAFFSDDDSKVYFVKSNEYSHSSPVGKDQLHGTDVYSISLKSEIVERVTKLNAYGIFDISSYNLEKILMYIPAQTQGGLILISKNRSNEINRLNPINNPREDLSLAHTPMFSKKYEMLGFIVPYELYLMNIQSKKAKLIVKNRDNPVYGFRFFNNQKCILYINENDTNFYVVNFEGSELKRIPIPYIE